MELTVILKSYNWLFQGRSIKVWNNISLLFLHEFIAIVVSSLVLKIEEPYQTNKNSLQKDLLIWMKKKQDRKQSESTTNNTDFMMFYFPTPSLSLSLTLPG